MQITDFLTKVGIIAGTPFDTKLGLEIALGNSLEGYGYPIAQTPQEHTILQYLNSWELTEMVMTAIDTLKKVGVDSIMIYCNSLSGSIDIDYIKDYAEIPIITPLDVYQEIAPFYDVLGLLAANCNSCAGIEKAILEANEDAHVIGYGNLSIVNDIERGLPPLEIIASHSIQEMIHIMEKSGAQIIILGCTHFPYFSHYLTSTVPIFDPAERMVQMIKNADSINSMAIGNPAGVSG